MRCNATLPRRRTRAALTKLAETWAGRGFHTFKLKVGVGGDVQQVARVREALGPEALLRVDANAAWRVSESRRATARRWR